LNRSSFAFFIAVLIHILLILILWILFFFYSEIKTPPKKEEKKIKISLKEMPKKYKDSGDTREKVKPSPIAPPMPKGSQLNEIVKAPPVKYQPNNEPQKPRLNDSNELVKNNTKTTKKVELFPSKDELIQQEQLDNKDPLAWMYEDRSTKEEQTKTKTTSTSSSINQNIKELYGEEFGKLTQGQQKYILDNQEIMRRITQQVLTRVASVNIKENLNVNKTNVIEFYLHPNGDMTDFRFLKKSGYYLLDDTTKETIEYAYSRYPRPTEKTLIRYNVYYNLKRY
jgi:periplasmic protein TonB